MVNPSEHQPQRMNPAPIALFAYNRPEHTREAIESLLRNGLASQSELHVFSDGARDADSAGRVAQVRSYLRGVTGFRAVRLHERERNMGLAASVIDGVSGLIGEHGRVIVVEDDLKVAPRFLDYMNAALEHYAGEESVMQISGHMFPVDVPESGEAFFLPFVSSWGWATWERAWRRFDPAAKGYETLKVDAERRRAFNMDGAYDYFSMLEAQLEGRVDSWAIRWNLSVFLNGGMVLYPAKSLVENTGFDGSGVHCGIAPLHPVVDTGFLPGAFPAAAIDPQIRNQVFDYFRAQRGFGARLRQLAARISR
jgi:GT2 family glycosyltransferase